MIAKSRVVTGRRIARLGAAAAGLGLLVAGGCGEGSAARKSVVVFHADSLAMPFEAIEEAFEKLHPDLDLQREPSGSLMAANKILLGNLADVIAVADYLVIDDVLAPEGHTDWSICFATNEIGIAYTTASKHRAELTPENWFEILTRDDVTVGAGDPDNDPCGYWTELCWKLADKHYEGESVFDRMMKACPRADRPDDAQQLMARLQSDGGNDYAWVYKSQAEAHRVQFLSLPPEINLADPAHAATYKTVSVEITKADKTTRVKRGHPIIFALTTIKGARNPEGGKQFVQFLLSAEGRRILTENHMTAADPPFSFDLDAVPADLKEGVKQQARPDASAANSP